MVLIRSRCSPIRRGIGPVRQYDLGMPPAISSLRIRLLWAALMAAVLQGLFIEPMRMLAAPPLPAANYDEAAVRSFTLPDPLVGPEGRRAASADDWRMTVRPHQFSLLERFVYGRRLEAVMVRAEDVERTDVTLAEGVEAIRMQATLRLGDSKRMPPLAVLLYLPKKKAPSPVFLELNFRGNQCQHADPDIRPATSWIPDDPKAGIVGNRPTEASRGSAGSRWPVESMLKRGFGMATAYCGDLFPDRADGRPESVLPALGRPSEGPLADDEPNAIAAWSWGLSRILDWLVTLPEVDGERVMVVGHSRLGKTALWAGACDERFAMIVSNESGCGGAALSRRNYGETVEVITSRFPHWFCPAFATFAGRETELPTDQHALIAMAAPRPLVVASAVEDRWADPRGEFLSAVGAESVWKLFGLEGLGTTTWPPVDTPVGRTVAYHVRTGGHDITEYDWQRFADHATRMLRD